MRIIVITPGYQPSLGGLETHVTGVVEGLAQLGADVEVWTQERGGSVPTTAIEAGVIVRRFPATSSVRFPISPGLFAHTRRHLSGADVVQVHGYHATPALAGMLAPAGVPLVFTPHFHGGGHSLIADLLHRPYRILGQRLFRRATRVVAVSAAERALLGQCFPSASAKTVVIHNAADGAGIAAGPNRGPTNRRRYSCSDGWRPTSESI